MSATTQIEIELLRNMGSAAITLGQQYHQYADFLMNGAKGPIVNEATGMPGAMPPPPFPGAAPAGAPAASGAAPASTGRKRRTKAEIAADEAAVAAGFVDAADMAAKQGAAGVQQSSMPPAPGVPGHQPPAMPGAAPGAVVPPPPAPPAAAAPQTTPHDNLQAALMAFGQAVENTWPGQGHGNGQMGLVVKKMNVPNIQAVPAENVQAWIDWIVGITAAFRADPSKLSTLTA